MKKTLQQLFAHQALSRAQAREALLQLSEGGANKSEIAAFMTVYCMRSIAADELAGFRDALLECAVKTDLGDYALTDVCGTGGDGKNTFNISTLVCFVVAAAGVPVAKHGNNGVSSASGSSDVLRYFGYRFPDNSDQLRRELDGCGVCFLHAPVFHPALKQVAEVRREFGMKTFFNMLGPLVNPAQPKHQLIGVFNPELARVYHYLCQQQAVNYTIVHSFDGYDEVSLTGPVKLFRQHEEAIYAPADFGSAGLQAAALYGGSTPEDAARLFSNILNGKGTAAQNEVVTVNAALALLCAGVTSEFATARERAATALHSGAAAQTFERLLTINKKYTC
jgi:anthranilate phosphoribosyltransferase